MILGEVILDDLFDIENFEMSISIILDKLNISKKNYNKQ